MIPEFVISTAIILVCSAWAVVNLKPKLNPVTNLLFFGSVLFLVGLYNISSEYEEVKNVKVESQAGDVWSP